MKKFNQVFNEQFKKEMIENNNNKEKSLLLTICYCKGYFSNDKKISPILDIVFETIY